MIRGGASRLVGSGSGSTYFVTPTSHATVHTKGGWTQIIAATSYHAHALLIEVAAAFAWSALWDIGIGGSGSERSIVDNIGWATNGSEDQGVAAFVVPLAIPEGTRISCRVQINNAGATGTGLVAVMPIGYPLPGFEAGLARATTYGVDTTTTTLTKPTIASTGTKGPWSELTAATTYDIRYMIVQQTLVEFVTGAAWTIDIGIGAASSEKVLVPDLLGDSQGALQGPRPSTYSFPCYIPAGTRLSARFKASSTALSGDLGIAVIGVG